MYNSFDREIKGYVEVLYDIKTIEYGDYVAIYYYNPQGRPVQLTPFEYGKQKDDILSTPRVIDNYAILYDDYVKLDGSFTLFNKVSNECGFITKETPQEIYDNNHIDGVDYDTGVIFIDINVKKGMNGITLYFKDNTIKNAKVEIYKETGDTPEIINIENNSSEVLFIDTNGAYGVFYMTIYEWTKPTHVMQWVKVDLGLSHVYKGEGLIEFTVTEQVNKLCEQTPNNELSLTIGDYDKLYDPLNPKGIGKYLTENCVYIPHIGIVDEYGGTSYTKMGEFYFFKNDYKDKEVTITAYNLIYKLSKIMIDNKTGSLFYDRVVNKNQVKNYLEQYLNDNYDYKYNITLENKTPMTLAQIKRTSLTEFLQNISMVEGIFFVDRDNNIVLKNIDKTIVEKITKNELLRKINYKENEKISSFNYTSYGGEISVSNETNTKNNFSTTIKLTNEEEIVCLTSDVPNSFAFMQDSYITQSGANSVNIIKNGNSNNFYYMIFLKVKGEVGKDVTITGKNPKVVNYSFDNKSVLINVDNKNKEPSFDLNNPFYVGTIPIYSNKFPNFIDKFYNYKVTFDYNGNPLIKAGNYIEVDSDYGTVNVFVEKHVLRYNGGLSGSIEGVE